MFNKLMDKLFVKLGWSKNKSPNLKARAQENGVISQRIIQTDGDNYYIEGSVMLREKSFTWAEKREAAETLQNSIEAFFYMVIGRGGVGGFLIPKNLNADGSIKEHCLLNCKREFEGAKKKLKNVIKENISKLEEADQIKLYELLDALLKNDMYSINESVKKETISKIYSILDKYFKA